MMFLLLLFGIIGTQLWNGLLHGTCHYWEEGAGWTYDDDQDGFLCALPFLPVNHPSYADSVSPGDEIKLSGDTYVVISNLFYEKLDSNNLLAGKYWYNGMDNTTTVARVGQYTDVGRQCADRTFGTEDGSPKVWSVDTSVSNATITLLDGSTKTIPTMSCRYGSNPNFDLSSFDNLGNAVLWIFASITLEGWVDSMYNVNQVSMLVFRGRGHLRDALARAGSCCLSLPTHKHTKSTSLSVQFHRFSRTRPSLPPFSWRVSTSRS